MSWAAHELEAYVIQKHVKVAVAFSAVLIGSWLPDMLTKFLVYGFDVGFFAFHPESAAQFHRGWPGIGFTHSLFAGVLVGLLALRVTRHRGWSLGLFIGYWAHALTDTFDSVGAQLLFPFSLENFSIGMWKYAAQEGRYGDGAAYYSSLGGVWDIFWLVLVLLSWRVLSARYYHDRVEPADPVFRWLRRRFRFSDVTLVALYRAFFFYGALRIFAWSYMTHVTDGLPWQISWGGPDFIEGAVLSQSTVLDAVAELVFATPILLVAILAAWHGLGRRLWDAAHRDAPPVQHHGRATSPT